MSSENGDDDERSVWSSSEEEWENESNEGKFEAEIGVYGRVGLPGSDLVGKAPTSRLEKSMQEPIERFRQRVNAIALNLQNFDSSIDKGIIIEMLTVAADLNVVEHKNPSAYVLGYLASGGGELISIENVNYVIEKLLPHVDESVLPPDIIRYARLWLNLKNRT